MSRETFGSTGVRNASREKRWLGSEPVVDEPLPEDFRVATGAFVGAESVETLRDCIEGFQRLIVGEDVEDLCHVEGSPHRGVIDGETYCFKCFFEALVVAELKRARTEIRTESPEGTAIEAVASGHGDVTVTPEEAVASFGVTTEFEPPDDGIDVDGSRVFCPYVRAFPDREAYERWADEVPAATVAMDFEAAIEVAKAFVTNLG